MLPQENIAVYGIVYLFPHHDSVVTKGLGHPILVWEGVEPEYLAKEEFY